MANQKRCITCKKRYVRQQSWKNQNEKNKCLSCISFERLANEVFDELQAVAKTRDIFCSCYYHPMPTKKVNAKKAPR